MSPPFSPCKLRDANSIGFGHAFQRCLYLLTLLVGYLFIGAYIFSALTRHRRSADEELQKLDFARAEFLHVLWAEAIGSGRGAHDWSSLAHQKLDSYERILLKAAHHRRGGENGEDGFWEWFKQSFLLITTIGNLSLPIDGSAAKLFAIIYTVVGIPLTLIYLGHCAACIRILLHHPRMSTGSYRNEIGILVITGFILLLIALLFDVAEEESDGDLPFIDALLSVFLTYTTVGVSATSLEKERIPYWLLYGGSMVAVAACSLAFVQLQSIIEGWLYTFENETTAECDEEGKLKRTSSNEQLSPTKRCIGGERWAAEQRNCGGNGDIAATEFTFTPRGSAVLEDVEEAEEEDEGANSYVDHESQNNE